MTEEQLEIGGYSKEKISAPPVNSVKMVDILKTLDEKEVILKLDVEGFECQVISIFHNLVRLSSVHSTGCD